MKQGDEIDESDAYVPTLEEEEIIRQCLIEGYGKMEYVDTGGYFPEFLMVVRFNREGNK